MHAFVERELSARVGDAGRRLHTGPIAQRAGRARPAALPETPHPGTAARPARADVARWPHRATDAGDALDAVRTPTCAAPQPILAAHYFLAHAAALRRDHVRFDAVLSEVDELPLGSGAIAGTSYPIDVARLASHARVLPGRRQQHRRHRRSRLRVVVPSRVSAHDGALQPARRGSRSCSRPRSSASSSSTTRLRPAAA